QQKNPQLKNLLQRKRKKINLLH
ncbi:uncharacterized protein METZ01_LOCUS58029, partial [marine metagenome]